MKRLSKKLERAGAKKKHWRGVAALEDAVKILREQRDAADDTNNELNKRTRRQLEEIHRLRERLDDRAGQEAMVDRERVDQEVEMGVLVHAAEEESESKDRLINDLRSQIQKLEALASRKGNEALLLLGVAMHRAGLDEVTIHESEIVKGVYASIDHDHNPVTGEHVFRLTPDKVSDPDKRTGIYDLTRGTHGKEEVADDCDHSPDPKKFAEPRVVGSNPDAYVVELLAGCVHCDTIGRAYEEIHHCDIEWDEDGVDTPRDLFEALDPAVGIPGICDRFTAAQMRDLLDSYHIAYRRKDLKDQLARELLEVLRVRWEEDDR